MIEVDWKGLILPFAYVVVLFGAFTTFSTIYRKRKAAQSVNLEPWFGPHLQRNIYLTLLHMNPEDDAAADEKTPRVPDSVLKAALLRRAVEDLQRLMQVRTAKQACSSLLQRGSVGDDLWKRFQRAEKEMEEELRDVVTEANALAPGWGQTIFQTANEMTQNAKIREHVDEVQSKMQSEKEWWEKRREHISSEFMKELDEDKTSTKPHSEDEAVLVDTPDKKAAKA